ncbi:HIRAN domain-containing protein [Lactobacillus gasseri]|uniref:HIRAN domain-containing protein n=1 Tax=Lactobacillus gasseri TaxID=1596 RepID=A0ABY3BH87_LACGS|nr:HIRAN domain-containing protein [Lactobacillus gasseri]MCZ3933393.1 HIRAN domain-containing protein [Lactobacillus gasseri]MCZ3935200.1 HIRAN domain-containing protein [Lactobacillus gasseri]MCZ3936983.1 HIRAN domain-containing protein [Lactobacillus gasseri]MCZ3944264.1 HIRAN domain-containing protein [Lactobacillus gasseri]MCZ3949820.1 HIRAN domain-containing protein [Lactobacillus gasseri]
MSIYRNDDVLITDLMDRIDKLENQVTDLKKIYYKQSGESHSTFLYGCEVRGSDYLHLEYKVVPRLKENDPVLLIREADNKYDKNAISVATPAGLKLGYIPREHNLIFSRLIDSGNLLFGRVKNFHWDGKNLELIIKVYLAN